MEVEEWMKHLEMIRKVRQHVRAKEKAQVAEQEKIRQEAEKRAWMKELEVQEQASCQMKGGREDGNSGI